MKNFKFSFHGRQAGAIGIFYQISDTYKAQDIHEAMSLLYEDYEHIYDLKCKVNATEIDIPKNINWVKVRSNNTRGRNPKNGSYLYTRSDTTEATKPVHG